MTKDIGFLVPLLETFAEKIFTDKIHFVHQRVGRPRDARKLYTTLEQLDRFCAHVEQAIERGLPGSASVGSGPA